MSDISHEIIVVDNGSSDGSREMLKQEFQHVKCVENTTNVGFSRANNQGIVQSTGKTVLLLNPDTELLPEAVQILLDILADNSDIGIVGPKLFNTDRSLQSSCRNFPSLLITFLEASTLYRLLYFVPFQVTHYYRYWHHDEPRFVDVVKGACILFSRTLVETIGLLDEDFFIYSEEADYCKRAVDNGYKVYFTPEARIIHHGEKSMDIVKLSSLIHLHRSRDIYAKKYFSRAGRLTNKSLWFLSVLIRLITTLPLILIPSKTKWAMQRTRLFYQILRWYLGLHKEEIHRESQFSRSQGTISLHPGRD
jgi:hypothetical protein